MTVWALIQDENIPQDAVGSKRSSKGRLPGPVEKPMSDLQQMLMNERKQHEQAYIYANGHNDHGLGQ